MAQRQPAKSDEWYTPAPAVEVLLPFLAEKSIIWCPFDLPDSNYVKVFQKEGHKVISTHIANNGDFFNIDVPECDYIISNPPYSKKDAILERLLEIGKPFALLMNVAGLYDSNKRFTLLADKPMQILYLYPRVKFYNDETGSSTSSPTYQSAYLCNGILPQQLMAVRMEKT